MGAFVSGFAESQKKDDDSKDQPKKKQHHDSKMALPQQFKKGGKVKKTGFAKVHKGERVLTKAQQRKHLRGK